MMVTMHRRRYIDDSVHPVCALNPQGLRDVRALLVYTLRHWTDAPRLAAEAARHTDFFYIANGLRLAGFDASLAARQIVNDCYRTGIDVRDAQRVIEHLLEAVYRILDQTDARVR